MSCALVWHTKVWNVCGQWRKTGEILDEDVMKINTNNGALSLEIRNTVDAREQEVENDLILAALDSISSFPFKLPSSLTRICFQIQLLFSQTYLRFLKLTNTRRHWMSMLTLFSNPFLFVITGWWSHDVKEKIWRRGADGKEIENWHKCVREHGTLVLSVTF